jgi:putative effector of murein hydrolase
MTISGEIGGTPDLTAVFVVVTGVVGSILGEILLSWLPAYSPLARGAVLGLGAHGAGAAKAHEFGPKEGSVADRSGLLPSHSNTTSTSATRRCVRRPMT